MPSLTLAAADPVTHVVDKPLITSADGSIWYVSNVTIMLVLGALVTAALVIPAARRIRTGDARTLEDYRSSGMLANLVEVVCLFLRQEVFRPVLGDDTDRFCPMLWTLFWFILVCNLMGLIPLADLTGMIGINHGHGIGGTATQSIWVTGALAVIAFLFYNGVAFVRSPLGFLKHLTMGAPWYMWPIMVPVELIGTVIKPFALAIRLFANMTGGHLVIAVFLGFVGPLVQMAGAKKGFVVFPLLGAVAINMLEILVALIQAYIFTFLTCLFLGQLVTHEHDEHEGHDDHEEAPPMAPDPVTRADAAPAQG
jgi:F-type H+-transporting ATPase subunit a